MGQRPRAPLQPPVTFSLPASPHSISSSSSQPFLGSSPHVLLTPRSSNQRCCEGKPKETEINPTQNICTRPMGDWMRKGSRGPEERGQEREPCKCQLCLGLREHVGMEGLPWGSPSPPPGLFSAEDQTQALVHVKQALYIPRAWEVVTAPPLRTCLSFPS